MPHKIVVVDYGSGNLRSVGQALRNAAPEVNIVVSKMAGDIDSADAVVLPGQGAMLDCVRCLDESGLRDAVVRAANNKPLLGICIGQHMLFERSEEADAPGLAQLPGEVVKFPSDSKPDAQGIRYKVPHMGWNRVDQVRPHVLWQGIENKSWFYFVHSFYPVPKRVEDIVGQTTHGIVFTSAVARDNVFAAQFHPEKSAADGLRFFRNFVDWKP
ncbi:MAG: imidazole glycerol phosphate synthase subunit HisH [Ottowia sp.]|nr:imidazole glycerol phosphate synthase subunit HisH [Ottowia sp.]